MDRSVFLLKSIYTKINLLISFLNDTRRIEQADYLPTEQDILSARVPTTGVHQYYFKLPTNTFRYIYLIFAHIENF